MSAKLLEYILSELYSINRNGTMDGKRVEECKKCISDYLNENKSGVPQNMIYILFMFGLCDVIDACVKMGSTIDDNCMHIACMMSNFELIKLCLDAGKIPCEEDVNNIMNVCHKYKNPSLNGRIVNCTRFEELVELHANPNAFEFLHDKDKLYKIIDDTYKEGCRYYCGHYSSALDVARIPIFSSFLEILDKFIPERAFHKYQILKRTEKTGKILGYLFQKGYIMTPSNWNTFCAMNLTLKNLSTDSKKISVDAKILSTTTSQMFDQVEACIKKNKLQLDNECLENAINVNNIELEKYILKTFKIKIDQILSDKLYLNAFIVQNKEFLDLLNDKLKLMPSKECIQKYLQSNVSLKFITDKNLISVL